MVVELSLEIILPSNKCGHFLLQFAAVCPTRALSAGAHMPDAHALRRRALAPARSPPARTCAHLPLRARALRQVTRGARALSAGAHMPDARALRRRALTPPRSPPARTCAHLPLLTRALCQVALGARALRQETHTRARSAEKPVAPARSAESPEARACSAHRPDAPVRPAPPVHPDSGPTVTQDFTTNPSTYFNIYVMHTSVISRVYFP